jgi:anthranilate phosphoribosyltransferase
MKEILTYLFEKNILSKTEAKDVMLAIGQGKHSDPEIASFLTVYLMRDITPQELAGFREALLDLAVPVDLSEYNTIDVCGTGGDEKSTFNISTLTAFVVAGNGEKVVKHGNYAISSACGSSNILESLGYKFSTSQDKLRKEIEQAGICYLHAPLFHPAMKYVGPVRKSLRLKTFFNLLGPMVNPSRPPNQIVGVYNEKVVDLYHQVFATSGIHHTIIHSLDGYDEISLTGKFRAISDSGDNVLSPENLGLPLIKAEDIHGGNSVEEALSIFSKILEGKGTKAQNYVVQANAAFALKCLHPENSLEDCLSSAKSSIESGNARRVLKSLIDLQ